MLQNNGPEIEIANDDNNKMNNTSEFISASKRNDHYYLLFLVNVWKVGEVSFLNYYLNKFLQASIVQQYIIVNLRVFLPAYLYDNP